MKKAIKKLKREIAYLNDAHDAIHALTAYQSQDIDELKRQTDTLFKSKSDLVFELGNIKHLVNSKNGGIDALSNKLGNLKSDVQTIAKHVQNLEAEKEKNCSCHTNTQKTDKNAIESKQEGEKEYSETIVTNEMFNEELEKRLSESFIQDHPAFLLLNKDLDSNTIDDLIRAKLKSKGEHYSPNGDRYSNFKRLNNSTAKTIKKTVKERIENFMEKHEIWIEDYQAGDVSGTLLDLIESCIDVLNYYLLLDIYLKFNGEVK